MSEPISEPTSKLQSSAEPVSGAPCTLRLSVNGTAREVPSGTSVRALLRLVGLEDRRVAVAVNRTVVPRSAFETHPLAAGDRVEILEAVGGG